MSDEDKWAEYFQSELERITALVEPVRIIPPPTRTETIQAAWAEARLHWDREHIAGRLIVADAFGIVPDILFELVPYGGQWVIEAEGVVVERLAQK